MKLREIVSRACQEKTLVDALSFAAVMECERAITQAREFDRTGISTASHGGGWDTCFRSSFAAVLEEWNSKHGCAGLVTYEDAKTAILLAQEQVSEACEFVFVSKDEILQEAAQRLSDEMHGFKVELDKRRELHQP